MGNLLVLIEHIKSGRFDLSLYNDQDYEILENLLDPTNEFELSVSYSFMNFVMDYEFYKKCLFEGKVKTTPVEDNLYTQLISYIIKKVFSEEPFSVCEFLLEKMGEPSAEHFANAFCQMLEGWLADPKKKISYAFKKNGIDVSDEVLSKYVEELSLYTARDFFSIDFYALLDDKPEEYDRKSWWEDFTHSFHKLLEGEKNNEYSKQ